MSDDFYLVRWRLDKDENGRGILHIRIGWGVVWLAAAIFSVLVIMP